jgi:hypothetical protein
MPELTVKDLPDLKGFCQIAFVQIARKGKPSPGRFTAQ